MVGNGNKAMQKIYDLLNSEEPSEVVDSKICAIVGEWKFYEEYKKSNALQFLE